MILIDSSVWIAVLRDPGGAAPAAVRELVVRAPGDVATTDPIAMELLAGATRSQDLDRVGELIASMVRIEVDPARDYLDAAALYRAARSTGQTVRALADCLIAAVAIRHDAELWHQDAEFEVIAGLAPLRTRDLRPAA